MLYGRWLHAQLLTQPRLIAMLHSLIARRRVPQTQWRLRHKVFTSGLGLDAMSLAWPTVVQLVVSFGFGFSWGLAKSTLSFFLSYAHVNLCHFFSSSWCRGLAATSACGSSWTFLFTFLRYLYPNTLDKKVRDHHFQYIFFSGILNLTVYFNTSAYVDHLWNIDGSVKITNTPPQPPTYKHLK